MFKCNVLKFQQKVHENYVLELNDFVRNLISFYENKREPFHNNKEKEETKDKQKVKNTIKCRYTLQQRILSIQIVMIFFSSN